MTALFSVFLLSVHSYLGQWLSGCGTGRLGMWEEEVATVCLSGSMRCHQEKHTLLSLDFLAHALRSHVKILRAGNPKSIATSRIVEEEELHAAQLRLHGHVPEQLLWHTLIPSSLSCSSQYFPFSFRGSQMVGLLMFANRTTVAVVGRSVWVILALGSQVRQRHTGTRCAIPALKTKILLKQPAVLPGETSQGNVTRNRKKWLRNSAQGIFLPELLILLVWIRGK